MLATETDIGHVAEPIKLSPRKLCEKAEPTNCCLTLCHRKLQAGDELMA